MSFERPWALLALLPTLALLVAGALALARAPRPLPRARRALALGAEAALLLSLALAAAGLRLVRSSDRIAVVLVVDRSRSTDHVPSYDHRLRAWIAEAPRGARRDDLFGLVGFARDADTALAPSPPARDATLPLPAAQGPRDDSDLAAAITHALGDVPPDTSARLVLLSDGDQTRGDARGAAMLAAAAGVPVDVVPLARPPRRDVSAVRLRAPERVEAGAPVDLALVLRATQPGRGRVELLRDGRRVTSAGARWGAGEDVVHLRDEELPPGLHRYEARLVPDADAGDEVPGNEVSAGFVRVAGGARALIVTGRHAEGGGEATAGALRSAGLEVDRVSPSSAPSRPGEWARYDLVVLSDVRARDLDPSALPTLRDQVRELGGGLLMVGSDQSFGPGGYGGSAVEEVLPVTLDLRQHRMRGSVALAIVIDRSGSMSAPTHDGRTKLDLANEGAARSARMLAPQDQVAIAHVDTETSWTLPLRRADDPSAIERAARSGQPGGGGIYTNVGLRSAYDLLHGTPATIRHVLLLADGDDAEESESCYELTAAAHRGHVTTSVVAIGRGHDEPHLAEIARRGGGRYYLTEDARSLPAIFTEDTVMATRNPLREEPFRPRFVRAAEALRGVDPGAVPAVRGWVVTEARPRSEVLARAPEDDPWLARWQAGVGRSAVVASDLDGRWTADFLRWEGSTAMVSQLGLWLARGVHDRSVRVAAVAAPGRVRVEVDATTGTGRWDTGLDLEARVVTPSGETLRVPLEARGVGRYEAEVDAPRGGSYLFTVLSAGTGVVGVTGAEVMSSAELTGATGNPALLAEIASRTGGRVRENLRGLYDGPRIVKRSHRPLETILLRVALGALLLMVAFRRLPAPSLAWVRRWWGARRASTGGTPAEAATATEDALAKLRARREERRETTVARDEPGAAVMRPTRPSFPPQPTAPTPTPPTPGEEASGLDALVARKRGRKGR